MSLPLIGIVGPCGSGKSTLVRGLAPYGLSTRHIAQEHSYVKDMWLRISHPDLLVFLDASYPVTIQRRQLDWTLDEYQEQQRRLAHALAHADLYIMTDPLTPEQIVAQVVEFVRREGYF